MWIEEDCHIVIVVDAEALVDDSMRERHKFDSKVMLHKHNGLSY